MRYLTQMAIWSSTLISKSHIPYGKLSQTAFHGTVGFREISEGFREKNLTSGGEMEFMITGNSQCTAGISVFNS
jgi:hypothetical protein